MKYLLDTNICIYIIKKRPLGVLRRLKEMRLSDIGISSITLSELEYGVEKSERREQNKAALIEFAAPLQVFPYDDLAAMEYGRIRAFLEKRGRPLGPLDMLIAAHALALNFVLVTNNLREFRRVPALRVENWVRDN